MSPPEPNTAAGAAGDEGAGPAGRMARFVHHAGIGLLTLVFFFLPLNTLRPINDIAVADLLIALLLPVAFVVFLIRIVAKKRIRRLPWWLYAGAVLLLVSIGLVELFPPDGIGRLARSFDTYGLETGSSTVVGIRVIFALVVFPVVIGIMIDRWSTIDLLVTVWIAAVTISCTVALLDSFFGLGIQNALAYDPEGIRGYLVVLPGEATRMVGLSDHPNTLSLTALMVSPLVMMRMRSRRGVLIYGPVLLLLVLGILVSGARSGVAGLVLAVALLLLMDERIRSGLRNLRVRTIIVMVLVLAGLVGLVGVGVYSSPESTAGKLVPSSLSRLLRSEEPTRNVSDNERGNRLEDTITYIGERPFAGYGFEWVESSHNAVLQLQLAGGPLALIGFYLVLVGYLRLGFGLRNRVPVTMRDTGSALTVSLLLYTISGLVDNHIFSRYLYIPAGLIFAMYLLHKDPPPAAPPLPSDQRTVEVDGGGRVRGVGQS